MRSVVLVGVASFAAAACATTPIAEKSSSTPAIHLTDSAPATPHWISLPAAPVPDSARDTTQWRLRFDSTPAPGVGVWESGTKDGCTLGPAIAPTMSPTSRGYITARHCDTPAAVDAVTFADAGHADARPVGVYTPSAGPLDATTVWMNPGTATPTTIAGHKVAGVLTEAAVKELPTRWPDSAKATPVCVYGAVTGFACGELSFTDQLTVKVRTAPGDSGAPMFLVDGNTGAITLLGLLTRGVDDVTLGEFLEPALKQGGAMAVTDRSAAISPAKDKRYSDRAVATA